MKLVLVGVYTKLIIADYHTFEQVPATLQADVQTELNAMNLNTDGTPIAE